MKINVTFSQSAEFPVTFDEEQSFSADFGSVQVRYIDHETYTGETVVTPSDEPQTLYTANLVVGADIVINPIPSNYGLISWSGSGILVS